MPTRRAVNLAILSRRRRGHGTRASPRRSRSRPIALPPPRADFGKSLAQALKLRRSIREYDPRPLPPQVLSELLWSAYGVNRPATADRTAPSWRHARETEIYAATADGVWRYDPIKHVLVPHLAGDVRAQTGVQDFVGTAPLESGLRVERRAPERRIARGTASCGRRRYRLHRPERLSLLRVGRSRLRVPRLARYRASGPHAGAGRDAVHHVCADGRV